MADYKYTEEILEKRLKEEGELFVVLDSGETFEFHGTNSIEFETHSWKGRAWKEAIIEGTRDGEMRRAYIPLESIEHLHTHREI